MWEKLFGWLGGRNAQMAALNDAIASEPDAPINYVRRGELRLAAEDFSGARDDFERALALAEAQFKADRWGITLQTIQDRAAAGLADVAVRAAEPAP